MMHRPRPRCFGCGTSVLPRVTKSKDVLSGPGQRAATRICKNVGYDLPYCPKDPHNLEGLWRLRFRVWVQQLGSGWRAQEQYTRMFHTNLKQLVPVGGWEGRGGAGTMAVSSFGRSLPKSLENLPGGSESRLCAAEAATCTHVMSCCRGTAIEGRLCCRPAAFAGGRHLADEGKHGVSLRAVCRERV